jgi:hypothetical protein
VDIHMSSAVCFGCYGLRLRFCVRPHILFCERLIAFGIRPARTFDMKQTSNPQRGDRHSSRFMVRLPEIFRNKLRLLSERSGKPITQLVQAALKTLLRGFGLWHKEDERELERQEATRGFRRTDTAT